MASKAGHRKFVKSHQVDATENRRRRQETTLSIRKTNKEGILSKRRGNPTAPRLVEENVDESKPNNPAIATGVSSTEQEHDKKLHIAHDISQLLQKLINSANDDDALLQSIRSFRRLLSVEENPPAQEVLECGALSYFVQLLSHPNPEIIFEATWALTNIASTDHTLAVVGCNAVPPLVKLLMHDIGKVRDQAIWCLGNIAGDSTRLRDIVLQAGVLPPLLKNITEPASDSLLNNGIWTLSNLCRRKPEPALDLISPALPYLVGIVTLSPNTEALVDALWALSFISEGGNDRIEAVMAARSPLHEDTPITTTLVELLKHESMSVVKPALRVLGNFVSGSNEQTQRAIDAGLMSAIYKLYKIKDRQIKKDLFWMLSNVAAGTTKQMKRLIDESQHLQKVLRAMKEGEFEVRKEALWVIHNILSGVVADDKVDVVVKVCEMGAIESLASMLTLPDPETLCIVLDSFDSIFRVGEITNKDYTIQFDEFDGIDRLESLQQHENDDVYEKAVHLVDRFFEELDEGEVENLAPATDGNTFGFGVVGGKGVAQKLFQDDSNVQMPPSNRTVNL